MTKWYEDITLNDIILYPPTKKNGTDDNHMAVERIKNYSPEELCYIDLRSICSILKIPKYKNKKKAELIELIAAKKSGRLVDSSSTVELPHNDSNDKGKKRKNNYALDVGVSKSKNPKDLSEVEKYQIQLLKNQEDRENREHYWKLSDRTKALLREMKKEKDVEIFEHLRTEIQELKVLEAKIKPSITL